MDTQIAMASAHLRDILSLSIGYTEKQKAVIVYDTDSGLSCLLTEAYRSILPHAHYVDFNRTTQDAILALFSTLAPHDLVILIQSGNFKLNAFRIRLRLFVKQLKVIEHVHLARNNEDVWDVYIDALAYDSYWYRTMGPKLASLLDNATMLTITGENTQLNIDGRLELTKLNVGDYRNVPNIGGTFPIGEVFTEAKEFTSMNGSLMLFAYADSEFKISFHEPFRIDIEKGLVVGWSENTPDSFIEIVKLVSASERPLIREIGFGLNRAITKERPLQDITAFERMYGMHVSLGEKHNVYKKTGIASHKTKFHIDLFPAVTSVTVNEMPIYQDGHYTL